MNAEEAIRRMLARYRNLDSYEDSGTFSTSHWGSGLVTRFRTKYKRPSMLMFELEDMCRLLVNGNSAVLGFSVGKELEVPLGFVFGHYLEDPRIVIPPLLDEFWGATSLADSPDDYKLLPKRKAGELSLMTTRSGRLLTLDDTDFRILRFSVTPPRASIQWFQNMAIEIHYETMRTNHLSKLDLNFDGFDQGAGSKLAQKFRDDFIKARPKWP